MLILTRRPGERVVIGEDVLVTVMEVSGQTVRLGIAAPEGLPIYREEIWLAVKEENRAAAAAADSLPTAADGLPTPSQAAPAQPASAQPAPAGGGDQRPS
jgi:carbon storage regulator